MDGDLPMLTEQAQKCAVTKSEIDFWEIWAKSNEGLLLRKPPTIDDLGDPFVSSSNERFVESMDLVEGLRILDIGCGLGSSTLFVASKGADAVGIDITKEMILQCRKQSKDLGLEAEFVVGDAENLPFKEGSFHRVVGERAIHHFPNLMHFFQEVHRVITVGGRAVFIEPQRSSPIVEVNRKLLRPEKRTAYEHPLTTEDIESARAVFPNTKVETFYLVSPISFLFR